MTQLAKAVPAAAGCSMPLLYATVFCLTREAFHPVDEKESALIQLPSTPPMDHFEPPHDPIGLAGASCRRLQYASATCNSVLLNT